MEYAAPHARAGLTGLIPAWGPLRGRLAEQGYDARGIPGLGRARPYPFDALLSCVESAVERNGLAVLNALALAVTAHPWSTTWAFALWSAKLARVAGWDPAGDPFWSADFPGTWVGLRLRPLFGTA